MSPEQLAHKIAEALTSDEFGVDTARVVDKDTVGVETEDGEEYFIKIEAV